MCPFFWFGSLHFQILAAPLESIRIFIYQIEQTYVKQSGHLSSFEVVLNKHGTSVSLKLSPEIYSEPGLTAAVEFLSGKVCGFQSLTVSKRSQSKMFSLFLNANHKLTLMSLYYLYHHLFFLLGSPLSI